MDQLRFNEKIQAELKLANERALQFEVWEKVALAKLSKANIKNIEIHEANHQTFLQLHSCLQRVDAIQAHMNATMQARDRDIFWRLANPLRNCKDFIPRIVIVYSRKILKLSYWIVTPWKMKTRLEFIKNRNNLQKKQLSENLQLGTLVTGVDQQINNENIFLNASSKDLYERILKSMARSSVL